MHTLSNTIVMSLLQTHITINMRVTLALALLLSIMALTENASFRRRVGGNPSCCARCPCQFRNHRRNRFGGRSLVGRRIRPVIGGVSRVLPVGGVGVGVGGILPVGGVGVGVGGILPGVGVGGILPVGGEIYI